MKHQCIKKYLQKQTAQQTIATFQCNISKDCWAQYVACIWPPCYGILRHWVVVQTWKWSDFPCSINFVEVSLLFTSLARFVQQCCAKACALVRFATHNVSQHIATGWCTCCAQQCCDMLHSNVAIIWLGLKAFHLSDRFPPIKMSVRFWLLKVMLTTLMHLTPLTH